jgi:hypothetical protein
MPLVAGVTVVHHRWLKQYKLRKKISHLCNIWLFFTEREKGDEYNVIVTVLSLK